MAGYKGLEETPAKEGQVAGVKQQWLVHEDGVFAHKLQEKEFEGKYSRNKGERQVARKDVPLARVVHSEEEERLQRERMEYLERQQAQAEKDAEIARKVHQEEVERINKAYARAEADAVLAKQAYEEEMSRSRSSRRASDNDAELAHRYQQEELTTKDLLGKEREKRDQELAIQMQENERRKYEIRMQQKSLAKKKKEIQQKQLVDAQRVLGANEVDQGPDDPTSRTPQDVDSGMANMSVQDKPVGRILRSDGKVEDFGDFSDFYIQPCTNMDPGEKRELQELQDEELARLLQDQEHKRGASIDKSRLKKIEDRDAELARVMMEQERLKVLKRKEAKLRQQQQRQMSEPGRQQSQSIERMPHRGGSLSSGQERYEHQNHFNEHIHSPPNSQEDGSGGGIRALNRQNVTPQSVEQPPDRDAHYQSSYGQRPLPATPASGMRQSSEEQISPSPQGYNGNGGTGNDGNQLDTYLRPQGVVSPIEDDTGNAPVSNTNVIAAIDPTFQADHEVPEPPAPELRTPSLRTPSPVRTSPPQTINRLPPTAVTSGGEDSYCDLDDVQNFTPVQGQKRTSTKRESKKGSKKDKNCKQQ